MSQKKNLRRSNGEGTFFQSHGKWRGQFSITKDNKLIRRAFSGNSKLEVYKLGKQWIEATQQNTSIFSSKNTKLKDICNYWLQDVKKVSVKPKTFQKYDSTLRLYILPFLGEIKIVSITPQQVQTVLNNWSNGTLKGKKGHIISSSTIRCTRRYLSELFEYAVNIGLLLKNPIKLTKPPRLITTEIHTLSLDEIHQLTSTMKQQVSNNISSPYRINYYASYIATKIALGTGMRLGEVFGLCWDCVDLIHGTISVRRTIQTGTKGQVFQDTKTKTSRRCIPISQELQSELAAYKEFQSNYAKELGDKWADS